MQARCVQTWAITVKTCASVACADAGDHKACADAGDQGADVCKPGGTRAIKVKTRASKVCQTRAIKVKTRASQACVGYGVICAAYC